MKFKSALGIAALEELTEDQVPAADDAAVTTAAGDTPAADTSAGADAGADAGVAADAGADDAAGAADAGAGDTGAGSDDAAAASAVDNATAQVDATGDASAVVADAAPVDADAEVVEAQMGEVDQLEEKAGDVQEDVEKLEAATESLEGCIAILDAAAQRGGLDLFGASLLRNNVNTVTKSLKVKPLMLPALEDMETPSSKVDGAQTAKEQIVAFVKRIIEAIKSAFVRLGEWIVETYKRLTDAFNAVERRAEKLAEKLKTSKMKEGAIDNKGLATRLTINGKQVEDMSVFLTSLTAYATYLNDPKSYRVYLEALDLGEELAKNPEKEEEIFGKISEKLASWAAEMEKHGKDMSIALRLQAITDRHPIAQKVTTPGTRVFGTQLLNNQVLLLQIPESARGINGMSSVVTEMEKERDGDAVTALDMASAEKICKLVADLAKSVRESNEAAKGGVKELIGEINKRKETISAILAAGVDASLKEAGRGENMRKIAVFLNTFLLSSPKLPVHGINRALPRNLGIALDYVAASIGGAAETAAA